jgi:hypothetical protein
LVVYDGYLYSIGGLYYTGSSLGCGYTVDDRVYYAPITGGGTVGSWTQTQNLPKPICHHVAQVSSQGKIYVVGGYDYQGTHFDSVYSASINADGSLGPWCAETVYPIACRDAGSTLYNDIIYVVGGYSPGIGFLDNVYYASLAPTPTFNLTVSRTGTGNGTVTSNPAGIDCGSDCIATYASDTPVTLTADATPNSVFSGWIGCDSYTDNQCVVTMDRTRGVIATFSPIPICNFDTETKLHLPTSEKALILTPYHHADFVGYGDELETALKSKGWDVHHYRDDEVSIPRMDEWLDEGYGLINITTHGSYRHIPISVFDNEAERDWAYAMLSGYYGTTIVKGHSQEAKYYIGIRNTFIYNYCTSLKEHPLVYMEGCYMASSDPDLREAFLCKGAGAYVGFAQRISINKEGGGSIFRTARDVSRDFYDYLLDLGYSVRQAREATDPGDRDNPFCQLCIPLQSCCNDEYLILEDFTIYALTDLVESMNLPVGIENSLVSKLEGALTSLEKGNAKAAINKLNAFINEVEAQRGKKITELEADQLINGANWIIHSIEAGVGTLAETTGPVVIQVLPNPVQDVHTATFRVMGGVADLVEAIRVQVFDLSGRLVYEEEKAGSELDWHTEDLSGRALANGVYLYQVQMKLDGAWTTTDLGKIAILR